MIKSIETIIQNIRPSDLLVLRHLNKLSVGFFTEHGNLTFTRQLSKIVAAVKKPSGKLYNERTISRSLKRLHEWGIVEKGFCPEWVCLEFRFNHAMYDKLIAAMKAKAPSSIKEAHEIKAIADEIEDRAAEALEDNDKGDEKKTDREIVIDTAKQVTGDPLRWFKAISAYPKPKKKKTKGFRNKVGKILQTHNPEQIEPGKPEQTKKPEIRRFFVSGIRMPLTKQAAEAKNLDWSKGVTV